MENQTESFVVDIEELLNPADDEDERAALDASVSVEAFEMIPLPSAA
jgi:hypothetical protein